MPNDVPVIYVDGILDVLNLGPNVAVTYFRFARSADGEPAQRFPVVRLVRPRQSLMRPDGAIAVMAESQADPTRRTDLHS